MKPVLLAYKYFRNITSLFYGFITFSLGTQPHYYLKHLLKMLISDNQKLEVTCSHLHKISSLRRGCDKLLTGCFDEASLKLIHHEWPGEHSGIQKIKHNQSNQIQDRKANMQLGECHYHGSYSQLNIAGSASYQFSISKVKTLQLGEGRDKEGVTPPFIKTKQNFSELNQSEHYYIRLQDKAGFPSSFIFIL